MATITILLLSLLAGLGFAQDSSGVCLKETGNLTEGCIAIQVPWKSSFMYICPGIVAHSMVKAMRTAILEKEEEQYTMRKCDNPQHQHPREYETGTFVVKTAWNCFDSISYPDPCSSVNCPLAPYNRSECKEVKGAALGYSECCPSYWCGAGEIPECNSGPVSYSPGAAPPSHLSISQPAGRRYTSYRISLTHRYYNPRRGNILEDPKNPDGSYCVPFPDRFNCTNLVHMCKDQEKPGRCPTANEMDPELNVSTLRPCVGDYSCPGEQKCCKSCSNRFNEGYCMEIQPNNLTL